MQKDEKLDIKYDPAVKKEIRRITITTIVMIFIFFFIGIIIADILALERVFAFLLVYLLGLLGILPLAIFYGRQIKKDFLVRRWNN